MSIFDNLFMNNGLSGFFSQPQPAPLVSQPGGSWLYDLYNSFNPKQGWLAGGENFLRPPELSDPQSSGGYPVDPFSLLSSVQNQQQQQQQQAQQQYQSLSQQPSSGGLLQNPWLYGLPQGQGTAQTPQGSLPTAINGLQGHVPNHVTPEYAQGLRDLVARNQRQQSSAMNTQYQSLLNPRSNLQNMISGLF
jgi:hypothetical protein